MIDLVLNIWSSILLLGELKKLLTAETGLQPGEQRLLFRGKERENGDYLDMSGVKDRSKIVLIEDPSSREKRFIEMRRNAKIQSAHRAISDVSMEVDNLADQVSEPMPFLFFKNKLEWYFSLKVVRFCFLFIEYVIRLEEYYSGL